MRRTVAYAVGKAQAMVGDPKGQYATFDKLIPLLNQAQDEMVLTVFRNEAVNSIQGVVVIPAFPAYSKSLAPYMAKGQPLENLISILGMKERPAGSQDDQWTEMSAVIADLPTSLPQATLQVWKWMETDVLFIGCDQNEDLRIYGEFAARELTKPDDVLIPSSEAIVATRAAALLSLSRNAQLAATLEARARDLEDELLISLVRQKQDIDIQQLSNVGGDDDPLYL